MYNSSTNEFRCNNRACNKLLNIDNLQILTVTPTKVIFYNGNSEFGLQTYNFTGIEHYCNKTCLSHKCIRDLIF